MGPFLKRIGGILKFIGVPSATGESAIKRYAVT